MRFVISIALAVMAFHDMASARIINIPADYSTIQAGINASVNGDTVLVQQGLYTENINFSGHQIVLGSHFLITGDTITIGETIIDGGAAGTVVTFANTEDSAFLIGFTIRNGRSFEGGGIKCDGASPSILNNIITANAMIGDGSFGGGIHCLNHSHPRISHNWIIGNRAGYGAGIATNRSSPLIYRNFIYGNAATWSEVGGSGGGIYCNGNSVPVIRGNEIRADTAFWGGAGIVCFDSVQATIEDNTISENYGGGIQLGIGNSIVMNNFISNNSMTPMGGSGINCYNFSGSIFNNVIVGNSGSNGGGIFCYSRLFAPSIANNVICNNTSGIYLSRSNQAIVNSIIWGNDAYEIRYDSLSNPSITYSDVQGGWPGEGNIDSDPLFRDTLNGDYHLQWMYCGDQYDSPCVDAGDPGILDNPVNCSWGLGSTRSDMGAYGGPSPPSSCIYIPGDINGNGAANGIDIVFAVNYFKGGPNPPPIDCHPDCPTTPNPFYAAGDVNGNCAFNGIDITFFVRYLRDQAPSLLYCADCLPVGMNPPSSAVIK